MISWSRRWPAYSHVRFTPESGHVQRTSAMSAKCQMQTYPVYSITSSALKDGRAFVFTMSQVILIGMAPRKSRLPISTPQ